MNLQQTKYSPVKATPQQILHPDKVAVWQAGGDSDTGEDEQAGHSSISGWNKRGYSFQLTTAPILSSSCYCITTA